MPARIGRSETDIDIAQINVTDLTVEQVVRRIEKCASNKQGFDIFQITAFLYCNRGYGNYWSAAGKSVLCLLTQLPALIYIISEFIHAESGRSWCNTTETEGHMWLRYFAFLFAAYIAMRVWALFQDTIHGGMYCVYMATFTNLPDCLSGLWLFTGAFYNTACFVLVVCASMLVILMSEKVFDMVLNCVALLFLMQMDDTFVTAADYKHVEIFFAESGYRHTRDNACDLPYPKCWFKVAMCIQIIFFMVYMPLFLAMPATPFLIAYCM